MTELVGLVVRGRWRSERLQVDDLDSLVSPDGKRWLPVLRIVHAFRFRVEEEGTIIRLMIEGAGNVELDLLKGQVQIRGQTKPIELIQAASEVTLKPDIYVSPEDLSQILGMELSWNTELYAYEIQLDRKLSVWSSRFAGYRLSRQTEYVESDLPEALPSAGQSRDALQLVEFTWSPGYTWHRSEESGSGSHRIDVAGPRESFWGNTYEGQYNVQITHPSLTWSSQDDWRWAEEEAPIAWLDWFEWTRRLPSAEITLGDSAFGLSDLVYPAFNATGVRINGLAGWSPDELDSDRSQLGLRRQFSRPIRFEGPAPIGAEVELVINGRTIASQDAVPQADSPPGMGVYRFEDIRLANGILNEVAIVIKEANGNEIRVEKSVMGTPQLIPKGGAAYLGVAGSKREQHLLSDRDVIRTGDFNGYITGARLLYGLTDRFTIGTALAVEEDQYHRYLESESSSGNRRYPESSSHGGAFFSYLPLGNLIFSGDVAGSQSESQEGDRYDDIAMRTRMEYLPTRKLSLDFDLLNLGADYFDGGNPDFSDRRGGETGLRWKWDQHWSLEAGTGQIRNNLNDQLAETLQVDYQNVGLQTSVVPRTSLKGTVHRLTLSSESNPRMLTELGLYTRLGYGVDVSGRLYLGEDLAADSRFLSPLRLEHAPWALSPSQYWSLRKRLGANNALSLFYNDGTSERTLSLAYDTGIKVKNRPLRVRTEVIRELEAELMDHEYGFRAQAEYLFDDQGYNRLRLRGECREGDYAVILSLNIRSLFAHHDGRFININESRTRPAQGAIHGKVFLDYNGNHILDPNEPGIPNIKVNEGRARTVVTDERGYYILPAPANVSEARVYLDATTVPAYYAITHGTQLARIFRDSLTEVNLSVAPLISVVGQVVVADANTVDPNAAAPRSADPNAEVLSATVLAGEDVNDVAARPNASKPAVGVRVYLSNPQSGLLVAESYTASDGSYYLGDVKPGSYKLCVDPNTLPKGHTVAQYERMVTIKSTEEEFAEINQPDFVATPPAKAAPSKAAPSAPTPLKTAPSAPAPSGSTQPGAVLPEAAPPAVAPTEVPVPAGTPPADKKQEEATDPNAAPAASS